MNEFGKELIESINKKFGVSIELTEENSSEMSGLVGDIATSSGGLGFCDDCDERRHSRDNQEPNRNEAYD